VTKQFSKCQWLCFGRQAGRERDNKQGRKSNSTEHNLHIRLNWAGKKFSQNLNIQHRKHENLGYLEKMTHVGENGHQRAM
jgi:hypothetical protein